MFKRIFSISVACLVLAAWVSATSYQTVPKPVVDFYTEVMDMFSAMLKELNGAKEAKAVAAAFNRATKTATDKKFGARYQELAKQYPEFFSEADGDDADSAWVPPADWIKITNDFNQRMMDYGANAGNIMSSMGTPEVLEAMEKFGTVMEGLASEE